MKILVDEDLPKSAVGLLRGLGHDAEHVTEIGRGGASDRAVFDEAQRREALLFTADLGFGNILAFSPSSHAGIVLLRFPDYYRRDDILTLIARFAESADLDCLAGALAIVTPSAYRIRRQP